MQHFGMLAQPGGIISVGNVAMGMGLGTIVPGMTQAAWSHLGEATVSTEPLPRAEMSLGEFVGWRIWLVRRQDRLLQSYSAQRIWLPGEPMEGRPSDHGPEGVWAFTDPIRAAAKVREVPVQFGPVAAALGSVWLWGEIIEHAGGYRAEFASVRSIDWAGPEMASFAPSDGAAPVNPPMIRYVQNDRGERVAMMADEPLLAALHQRYGVGVAAEADARDRAQKKSAGRE